MKLLIDANLSYRLSKRLSHLFEDVLHVEHTGLPNPATDIEIWFWAKKNGYILILTRDEDFAQLQNLKGHPPKIVILRIQNRTTQYVAALIEKHFDDLFDLAHNDALGLLEIFEN